MQFSPSRGAGKGGSSRKETLSINQQNQNTMGRWQTFINASVNTRAIVSVSVFSVISFVCSSTSLRYADAVCLVYSAADRLFQLTASYQTTHVHPLGSVR